MVLEDLPSNRLILRNCKTLNDDVYLQQAPTFRLFYRTNTEHALLPKNPKLVLLHHIDKIALLNSMKYVNAIV